MSSESAFYQFYRQTIFDSVKARKRYILGFPLAGTQDNANIRCMQGNCCG